MNASFLNAGVAAGRAAGRGLGPAARVAGRLGIAGLGVVAAFGATAGTAALAAGYAAHRVGSALGGGQSFHLHDGTLQLRSGVQQAAVGAALGAAAIGSVARAGSAWQLSQTGGMPEMERSDFLGATGSLAFGGRAPKWQPNDHTGLLYRLGHVAEDVAHMLIRS